MAWTRLVAIALLAGCAHGGAKGGDVRSSVREQASIATAGNRCKGGGCTCRRVDQLGRSIPEEGGPFDEGAPAPGQKRFELRTGRGLDPQSITVEGRGTLHKDITLPAGSCAYVDLPPGRHRVVLRARAQNPDAGMTPAFFVSEYSAEQQSWYATFQMRCGGDGPCELGHMEQWNQEAQQTPRGLWDPCGSTRIEGIRWGADRTIGTKLGDLEVELTLDVYKFEPRFPHGAPRCKGPSARQNEPADPADAK